FKEIEGKIKNDAIIATNTSSLKLSEISSQMKYPNKLIGLHFFSPVSHMPLVEVVKYEKTKDDDIAKGAIFVTSIEKFPLVTKDVSGFLVNKVLGPYMFSAISKVEEGESKDFIDHSVRSFGMPMGPIELADSVGLDVCLHVAKTFGHASNGTILNQLVEQGKLGKKTGEGFYTWINNRAQKIKIEKTKFELEKFGRELIEPLLRESKVALSENVVANEDLVDAGMIFGTGFPPFRGGPLHFMKYENK
ncbi:MAG: 3-hydroxyacyl-CoA dehydrogenase family protein, partial [Hyphomicrobium sp.]